MPLTSIDELKVQQLEELYPNNDNVGRNKSTASIGSLKARVSKAGSRIFGVALTSQGNGSHQSTRAYDLGSPSPYGTKSKQQVGSVSPQSTSREMDIDIVGDIDTDVDVDVDHDDDNNHQLRLFTKSQVVDGEI